VEKDSKVALMAAAAAAQQDRKTRGKSARQSETQKGNMMRMIFGIFPLLIIPVALYALLTVFSGGDTQVNELGEIVANSGSPLLGLLSNDFISLPMISGVKWTLNNGDAIILLAIALLFLEILKSTSTGTATIMNHAVSMMLFILCLVLFLLNANFATSTFFILMSMTLLDVLAGVVVTIVSARRDFGGDLVG
jgi:membrane protein insertase Oxa1/YidC/SpoIIIJ